LGGGLRRALSTLGCPDFTLAEAFALTRRHGIGGVELRALGGTVKLVDYFAREFGTPEGLATFVRESGVEVVAVGSSLHLVGGSAAEREEAMALAPWADRLGVRWLRVFDGGKNADGSELEAALETLDWWRGVRRERGWKVDAMVETHGSFLTAPAIGRLLAAAPGTAILWDAHHTWRKGGEDPADTWRAIGASVVHVHVKDSIGKPSARHPFTYVLPGTGEFPMGRLLDMLRGSGFAGPVSLEWERLWHPDLPPLDEALAEARARAWW
jgi:sugar phosphate isomerase/epimerase